MPARFHMLFLFIALSLLPSAYARSERTVTPPFIWIEGESAKDASFPWEAGSVANPDLLSGGAWLTPKGNPAIPDEGCSMRYRFTVTEAVPYQLWLRIGYEWMRPELRWRVDGGAWTTVGTGAELSDKEAAARKGLPAPDLDRATQNVVALGHWVEAGWWHVGEVPLAAGEHVLELAFSRTHVKNPLLALDAICLVLGDWTPDGPLKPGARYDAPADREAAAKTYALPAAPAAPDARVALPLTGLWELARYDDLDMDTDPYEPIRALPAASDYTLQWRGVQVPGNLAETPGLGFAHRVLYRTRVDVPADYAGRGFFLHFSGSNWIASVIVNGQYAGGSDNVLIPWDLDVSAHIRPGEVNEIVVGIKGSYYAHDPRAGRSLTMKRNTPYTENRWSRWVAPIYPSNKGDGDGLMQGLVNPVTLHVAGAVYAEDVFVKPSVQAKSLAADLTLRNTTDRDQQVEVAWMAVHDADGTVAKRFDPVELRVPAGGTVVAALAAPWADPELWWPEADAKLYRLRLIVSRDGVPVDSFDQRFGFREVTVDGTAVKINGVPYNQWGWIDTKADPKTPEEWVAAWRAEGNRLIRFSYARKTRVWMPSREARLDFYDRQGVPGRLCSMIDGMFINYLLVDRQRDADGKTERVVPSPVVWENFRKHVAAMTKAYRNHPSVIYYQIENELIYVTAVNLYGDQLPALERAMLEVYEAGRANDPTRPYTVGGGGDLSGAAPAAGHAAALEINSPHYPLGNPGWYPGNAYDVQRYASRIERWPWRRDKPWIVGEGLHAGALKTGSYAIGPRAYRSTQDANAGKARFLRGVYGGYRWDGVAGFFPWDNLSDHADARQVFHPLYVIPAKQAIRLQGGRANTVAVKAMNDTRFARASVLSWTFTWPGAAAPIHDQRSLTIPPGTGVVVELPLAVPAVAERLEGALTIRHELEGYADAYEDMSALSILPPVTALATDRPLLVLDRAGQLTAFLDQRKVPYTAIDSLAALADPAPAAAVNTPAAAANTDSVLLVGPNTLTVNEALGRDLLAYTAKGGRAIVLEQDHVVAGANLASPVELTDETAGYTHPQALGSPIMRDLGREDLIDWLGDFPTAKQLYMKPIQGAASLVECGPYLPYSALLEVPAGAGVMLLCQLRVGEKLGIEPAAEVLLRNMVAHCQTYRATDRRAALVAPADSPLAAAIAQTGLLYDPAASLPQALDFARYQALIVDASPAHLVALLAARDQVAQYQAAGGWIMLCGLQPPALAAFNELLGSAHMLRPYRLERNYRSATASPLATLISDADLMLYGPTKVNAWEDRYWVSGNTYRYVVDGPNVAPFTRPSGSPADPMVYTPTRTDGDPYNVVNGMFSDDSWRYIRQFGIPAPDSTAPMLSFTFPRPETLGEIQVWNNTFYSSIDRLEIMLDGDPARVFPLDLPDSNAPRTLRFDTPQTVATRVDFFPRTWRTGSKPLLGIDNVAFRRAEPPPRADYLDIAGGLVAYPGPGDGAGGVFLNQLAFIPKEPVPENAATKIRVTATLLQNMGVSKRLAGSVAVPGVNIRYQPLDISAQGTRFMTHRPGQPGWFGDGPDLAALPIGKRTFASIQFHVPDYATAPVPDAIMLGGLRGAPAGLPEAVTDIPVKARADFLYFLHTASVIRPVADWELARIGAANRPFELPEVLRYVLHYADGTEHIIPVILGRGIDHWLQPSPSVLPDALIGWQAAVDGSPDHRVVYVMEAANPKPDQPIVSIDILPGVGGRKALPTDRAVPAVLAITLGTRLTPTR